MRLPGEQWWNVYAALRAIGDWPRARFAAERMLEASGTGADVPSRRLRYAAQIFLGEALSRDPDSKDDLIRSYDLFRAALDITRALARELDTPEARRDVSVSLDNVANAARARGDLAGAERLFAESLELRRALARELDTPETRRDVSVSLIQLSTVLASRADTSGAVKRLEEAREAAQEFGRMQPVSDARDIIEAVDRLLGQLRASQE